MPRSTDTRIARCVKQIFDDEKSPQATMSHQDLIRRVRSWLAANPAPKGPTRKREEIACAVVEAIRAESRRPA